jgi:hypothetical protein
MMAYVRRQSIWILVESINSSLLEKSQTLTGSESIGQIEEFKSIVFLLYFFALGFCVSVRSFVRFNDNTVTLVTCERSFIFFFSGLFRRVSTSGSTQIGSQKVPFTLSHTLLFKVERLLCVILRSTCKSELFFS